MLTGLRYIIQTTHRKLKNMTAPDKALIPFLFMCQVGLAFRSDVTIFLCFCLLSILLPMVIYYDVNEETLE